MRRVGIIPSMFLHFRQLLLSVNSYLEFITFFTTWLHRIREWMTPWSLDQKSNNGSLDITAPWDFNGSRKDLRLLSRKFTYTPWHAVQCDWKEGNNTRDYYAMNFNYLPVLLRQSNVLLQRKDTFLKCKDSKMNSFYNFFDAHRTSSWGPKRNKCLIACPQNLQARASHQRLTKRHRNC